jgi:hypothetical protein
VLINPIRGLNRNHDHGLKNVFKGAATVAAAKDGPLLPARLRLASGGFLQIGAGYAFAAKYQIEPLLGRIRNQELGSNLPIHLNLVALKADDKICTFLISGDPNSMSRIETCRCNALIFCNSFSEIRNEFLANFGVCNNYRFQHPISMKVFFGDSQLDIRVQ